MATAAIASKTTGRCLSCDEVLRIAQQDAETRYKDLDRFRITMFLADDGWHVEYMIAKPMVAGGGPHYVIDATTGTIVSKKYYQ